MLPVMVGFLAGVLRQQIESRHQKTGGDNRD